jgi:ribosome maturation protein Sdo1
MIEKFGRVVRMKNISDNYMTLIAMFDQSNQVEFFKLINDETTDRIEDALMSVNNFDTAKLMRAARSNGATWSQTKR